MNPIISQHDLLCLGDYDHVKKGTRSFQPGLALVYRPSPNSSAPDRTAPSLSLQHISFICKYLSALFQRTGESDQGYSYWELLDIPGHFGLVRVFADYNSSTSD